MTRQEMIDKIIADDLQNFDDYDNTEGQLKSMLANGRAGYHSYSNEALQEEYEDRFGKS